MPRYEYKVVPAPRKGQKAKGLKTPEDRFAHALTELMNRMGSEGWEYLRAETLPTEERSGWTSRTEMTHHLLVFCRPMTAGALEEAAEPLLRLAARRDESPAYSPRLGPARGED